ncbi:MAG TPA: DUF6569 family protein [Chitinophagaceae bacterium]|nr:DUF6569 family protein [Chitinophagaceae bacterium]
MQRLFLLLGMMLPVMVFSQEYSYRTLEFNLQDEAKLRSLTYKNLRVYPIKAKATFKEQTKNIVKYTSLKEALEKKKIRITEKEGKGEGAEVNTLYAQNTSSDTLFLMAGEVIQGGKQDRVIGEDVVIPPNKDKVKLPVFCVEHGRWSTAGRSTGNNFNGYFAVSGLSVRKAVEVDKNQSKVWEKVADGNKKNKVNTSTGTYTALASASDYQKIEQEYFSTLQPKLAEEKDIIGVIIASGDKVIGCEIFATEQLFRKSFDNLLRSYIHEAVTNGKPVTISSATVKAYMDHLLLDQRDQEARIKSKGKVFVSEGKKLHIATYE